MTVVPNEEPTLCQFEHSIDKIEVNGETHRFEELRTFDIRTKVGEICGQLKKRTTRILQSAK